MAKKRYVGFKYESIDDVEPVFDAKGIETVRRDGVLAQRKMVENCLKQVTNCQHQHSVLIRPYGVLEFYFAPKISAKSRTIAVDPGPSY